MSVTWDMLGSAMLGSTQNFWIGFGTKTSAMGGEFGNIGTNMLVSVRDLVKSNSDVFGWALVGVTIAVVGIAAWKIGGVLG